MLSHHERAVYEAPLWYGLRARPVLEHGRPRRGKEAHGRGDRCRRGGRGWLPPGSRGPVMEKLLRGVSVFIRRRRPAPRATFTSSPGTTRLSEQANRSATGFWPCARRMSADPGDILEVRTVGNIIAPADAAGENAMGDE